MLFTACSDNCKLMHWFNLMQSKCLTLLQVLLVLTLCCANACNHLQPPQELLSGYSRATHAQLKTWARNVTGRMLERRDQHIMAVVAAIEFICEHEWEEGECNFHCARCPVLPSTCWRCSYKSRLVVAPGSPPA